MFEDTIFALSSGHLPSGVAVVRVSGTAVRHILEHMAGGVPPARHAALCNIFSLDGGLLDRGIVLFFPGPSSFTGEDCCELHVHGGLASVSAVLNALGGIEGARLAEAGEFTRRAFMNGKMDLTQAEALSDLVAAETEAQRRLALSQSSGGQRRVYESWREKIVFARAMIEAELDFADESDVPGSVSQEVWAAMDALCDEVEGALGQSHSAEVVRNGFEVVIVGAPNAGKSSLLNALSRRDAAIVSAIAGTTRDLVEVRLDLEGFRVNLVDTAGLRESPEFVEGIGIERALERLKAADLVLLVEDMTAPNSAPGIDALAPVVRVGLKADLCSAAIGHEFCVSAASGYGLDILRSAIAARAREAAGRVSDSTPGRLRQIQQLELCSAALRRAIEMADVSLEVRAEELRVAGDCLSRLVGKIDVEELLGVIFSTFCVGK